MSIAINQYAASITSHLVTIHHSVLIFERQSVEYIDHRAQGRPVLALVSSVVTRIESFTCISTLGGCNTPWNQPCAYAHVTISASPREDLSCVHYSCPLVITMGFHPWLTGGAISKYATSLVVAWLRCSRPANVFPATYIMLGPYYCARVAHGHSIYCCSCSVRYLTNRIRGQKPLDGKVTTKLILPISSKNIMQGFSSCHDRRQTL